MRSGLLLLAVLLLAIPVVGFGLLWLSMPALEGQETLRGLLATITVQRDALGVVTIRGQNRLDVARAQGFVHGQERFFQMDLLRRSAAGELAALVGAPALGLDRARRLHDLRGVAREVVEGANPAKRALIAAYAEGVNKGLDALASDPFEYWLLRQSPGPWLDEDSVLAIFAMYFDLNDENAKRDAEWGVVQALLPPELYAFLDAQGTSWDAPLLGEALTMPPVPGADRYDLRKLDRSLFTDAHAARAAPPEAVLGSNNWAVAGSRTADGHALLANDMHLGQSVPNIWFRMQLRYPDPGAPDGERVVTGVSLPGTPSIVAGSNGQLAWGYTNSYGDFSDRVLLELDANDSGRYRVADRTVAFTERHETIEVAGAEPVQKTYRDTIWGPVIGKDALGRLQAVSWIAHDPEATNFEMLDLERAPDIETGQAVANRSGIPPQNAVMADAQGHIGWTIMGKIPRRVGYDPRLPASFADDNVGPQGYLAPQEYPRVVDPESGQLSTANARTVDGEALAKIGDGGYDLGARARQIRDDLGAKPMLNIDDMLATQLDDRALFLAPWQRLLHQLLAANVGADTGREELLQTVERWGGHASIDSQGYLVVHDFRERVLAHVERALLAEVRAREPDFDLSAAWQMEGLVWRLLQDKPLHLLDPRFTSWDELLLSVADQIAAKLRAQYGSLRDATWGARNHVHVRHPLSAAIPALSPFLDTPEISLPGDSHMPRVQTPYYGSSKRFAVSPGREGEGYFHMPGGQSGHPLSPFYRAGHGDWVESRKSPFLPGNTQHTLVLSP